MKFIIFKTRGFVATIAVVILATGCLVFSLVTLLGATSYSESIYKRELRIQAGLNASACLDLVTVMVSKDYFLSGQIEVRQFGWCGCERGGWVKVDGVGVQVGGCFGGCPIRSSDRDMYVSDCMCR
jgi:hypothetical protein